VTGQSLDHIAKLRTFEGKTRAEAAQCLGLCQAYVVKLAKDNRISLVRNPSPQLSNMGVLKSLAASGFTMKEASEETSLGYGYVAKLARENDIKFLRSGLALKPSPREAQMGALYRSGKTLQEIGDSYGITRERVRQLITKFYGLTAPDGGQHKQTEEKRVKFEARRNAASLKRVGCNWDQYLILREAKKPTRAYASQRQNAARRGIAWELNLWQWWSIWQQSGKWSERGRGNGYMMCRNHDVGPYAVGNVYVATGCENSSREHAKTSGLPRGVSLKKGMYEANRCIAGKKTYLGVYSSPDIAHAAYLAGERIAA
jgi:hypothetical protein